jgi:hypothetical protein
MANSPTDYTLIKLDKIEDLIREVKQMLVDKPSPSLSVQPIATVEAKTNPVAWLLSTNSAMWLLQAFWKHLPTLGAVVYMKATGQDAKIIAYLNATLFGI